MTSNGPSPATGASRSPSRNSTRSLSPWVRALVSATARASGLMSIATKQAVLCWWAHASARQPEPVPPAGRAGAEYESGSGLGGGSGTGDGTSPGLGSSWSCLPELLAAVMVDQGGGQWAEVTLDHPVEVVKRQAGNAMIGHPVLGEV